MKMKILGYVPDEDWIYQVSGFAEKLDSDMEVIVTDQKIAELAKKYFTKVYLFNLNLFDLTAFRRILKKILEENNPDVFVSPCTNKGRGVSGTFMGLSGYSGASDVIKVEKENNTINIERLVYGGTVKASLKLMLPSVLCIAPGYFKSTSKNINGEVIDMGSVETIVKGEFKLKEVTGNDPTKSDIVVVAGRGVKEKNDLNIVIELADKLKGAWSVTRPLAADYGWTDSWVGISGLVVNPKLYIGVGVSGQPHHMMGARNSKIIIAINKDPEAPIFEEADYGLVGDLYKIIPVLLKKFK